MASDAESQVIVAHLYRMGAKQPGRNLYSGTNISTGKEVTIKLEPAAPDRDATQGHLI